MTVKEWQGRLDDMYPAGALVEVADEPGDEDGFIVSAPRLVVVGEVAGRPMTVALGPEMHMSGAVLTDGPEEYGPHAFLWATRDGRTWTTRPIPEGTQVAAEVKSMKDRLPHLYLDADDEQSPHHEMTEADLP